MESELLRDFDPEGPIGSYAQEHGDAGYDPDDEFFNNQGNHIELGVMKSFLAQLQTAVAASAYSSYSTIFDINGQDDRFSILRFPNITLFLPFDAD